MSEDRGLNRLTELMQRNKIMYWVDSGVLLGLIRDGEMLPGEKDIDLAVESRSLQSLLALKPVFLSHGYDFQVNTYRGVTYSIGLKPLSSRKGDELPASIHVYYSVGNYLWSPQTQFYRPPPAPDVYSGQRSFAGRLLQRLILGCYYCRKDHSEGERHPELAVDSLIYKVSRWVYRKIDRGFLAETWPVREVYIPLTWLVPKSLVLPTSLFRAGASMYTGPGKPEEYLQYRYGQWRTPVKSWYYWRDDGAVIREKPMVVLGRLK